MKTLLLIASLLIISNLVQARIWTSKDGKTMEAEFIEMVTEEVIKIRMPSNGRYFELSIHDLAPSDQEFVKSLRTSHLQDEAREMLENRKARWVTNLNRAIKDSRKYSLPIMMLFTGSDWCSYCIELESNVLSQSEFMDFANQNLVLLKLDFPIDGAKKSAKKLAEEYGVTGYPSVHFIDQNQSRLGKIGGYGDWTPEQYISKIKKILK